MSYGKRLCKSKKEPDSRDILDILLSRSFDVGKNMYKS
jgi:hypothetical protein